MGGGWGKGFHHRCAMFGNAGGDAGGPSKAVLITWVLAASFPFPRYRRGNGKNGKLIYSLTHPPVRPSVCPSAEPSWTHWVVGGSSFLFPPALPNHHLPHYLPYRRRRSRKRPASPAAAMEDGSGTASAATPPVMAALI